MSSLSRRRFLQHTVQSLTLASVAGASASLFSEEAAAAAKLSRTALTDRIALITGAGGNVLVLRAPEGVLLVDGGRKEHAAALLKEAQSGPGSKQVRYLFNTHWHPEQTGLNERLGKMGTTIIAHENTRLWLGRPIQVDWLDKPFPALPEKARPNKTTYTTDTISFGGEDIEYGYMRQAHTDGDIYVHLRTANILHAGGVVSNAGWPLLDYQTGGWIGGLVAGYDRLLKVANDQTRIVPADGPLLTRADLDAHRKMYFTIYERVVECLNKGFSPEEAIATQPAKEYAAQWGDPTKFVDSAFRSLWGHYAADA